MSGRRKLTRLGFGVAAAVGVLIVKDYYRNSRASSTLRNSAVSPEVPGAAGSAFFSEPPGARVRARVNGDIGVFDAREQALLPVTPV